MNMPVLLAAAVFLDGCRADIHAVPGSTVGIGKRFLMLLNRF